MLDDRTLAWHEERDSLLKTIGHLREANQALEATRFWTEQQHQRWRDERESLLEAMRELRARNEELDPGGQSPLTYSRAIEQLKEQLRELQAWNAELEKARTWYHEQRKSWDQEHATLLRMISVLKTRNAELENIIKH